MFDNFEKVIRNAWSRHQVFLTYVWILLGLLPILPLILFEFDHWDGAILAAALETQNFQGVNNWLTEAGLIPYLLWVKLYELGGMIVPNRVIKMLLGAMAYLGLWGALAGVVARGFSVRFPVGLAISMAPTALFSTLFHSSIFIPMISFFALGLLGVRLMASHSWRPLILGTCFVILGMSYFHAVPILAILATYFYCLYLEGCESRQRIFFTITLVFLGFMVGFIIVYKILWASSGLYSNYSGLRIDINVFKRQALLMLEYPTFPAFLILVSISSLHITGRRGLFLQFLLISVLGSIFYFNLSGRVISMPVRLGPLVPSLQLRYYYPLVVMLFIASVGGVLSSRGFFKIPMCFASLALSALILNIYVNTTRHAFLTQASKKSAISYLSNLNPEQGMCKANPKSSVPRSMQAFYDLNYLTLLSKNLKAGQVCAGHDVDCVKRTIELCSSDQSAHLPKYIIDPIVCSLLPIEPDQVLPTCHSLP